MTQNVDRSVLRSGFAGICSRDCNLTGQAFGDWVTIWATTSTVSGDGDTGADPNKLVVVLDKLSNTDPTIAAKEQFFTLRDAGFGEVLRGVAFTPGTGFFPGQNE